MFWLILLAAVVLLLGWAAWYDRVNRIRRMGNRADLPTTRAADLALIQAQALRNASTVGPGASYGGR